MKRRSRISAYAPIVIAAAVMAMLVALHLAGALLLGFDRPYFPLSWWAR